MEDVGSAFRPVARLKLDSLKPESTVRLIFIVPHTAQWSRIRRAWGDQGYAAYGVEMRAHNHRWILPYSDLGLDLKVAREGEQMRLEKLEGTPYGHSSETSDSGVLFRPSPGDELEISITRRSASPAQGELVIAPYWDGYAKDHIVGAMIDSELRTYAWGMAILGIVSLIAGASLGVFSARLLKRHAANV